MSEPAGGAVPPDVSLIVPENGGVPVVPVNPAEAAAGDPEDNEAGAEAMRRATRPDYGDGGAEAGL